MLASAPVLVVEDDLDLRSLLGDLLRLRGFHVHLAEDAVDAIHVLERGVRPSVVLADLLMPGIAGDELVEYMQHRPDLARIPFAFVSGMPHKAPRGYKVFAKPINAEELVAFVRAAII